MSILLRMYSNSQKLLCVFHIHQLLAERIFSQLNLIKTRVRNSLLLKTCQSFLQAKDMIRIENKKFLAWQPPANITTYSNKRVTSVEVFEEDIF